MKNMEEKLISFKTAKLAREKGFILNKENEPIFEIYLEDTKLYYDSDGWVSNSTDIIYAPTQSLLQRWLREEHKITLVIYPSLRNGKVVQWEFDIYTDLADAYYESDINSNTYELALEQGLIEALNLIEI